MLSAADQECTETFTHSLRQVYPDALIWTFGSRARGEGTPESDLDICVVLNEVNWESRKAVSDLAWQVGFRRDRLVSTVVFSRKEFDHGPMSASPLVSSIREEGVPA